MSGDGDVGLGAGIALSARLKGVPTIGVAAIGGAPYNFTLIVPTNSAIKSVTDLKGRTVAVTTAGSVTDWLVREVARREGWGSDGIKSSPLGDDSARIAALRSGGVDADLAGLMSAFELQDKGQARILIYFGDIVKDFQTLVMKASDKFIAEHPDRLETFLKGWYRSVAYMKAHHDVGVKVVAASFKADPAAVDKAYDVEMKMLSDDGTFSPAGMETIRQSLVELHVLDKLPAMSDLYTERFVPVSLK
jgi:ABC-type nitrate/sulfonate/bicarbonate transport system substrate-binding protein